MKTLREAITAHGGLTAPALLKHLGESRLNGWEDLTKANLNDFRDHVTDCVAQSTARTYFAVLKTILARYEDEVKLPAGWRGILSARAEKPVKVYLTARELERLEGVEVRTPDEQYVLDCFMVGAYTGMRVSDARGVAPGDIHDGYLSYVSIKTGVRAIVPVKPGVPERIARIEARGEEGVSLAGYNKAIRRLCRRAGICTRVKVYKGGRHLEGAKWEFVSSHTARISAATNLSILGASLQDIKETLGHTSTGMTERYIVPTRPNLSARAMAFFK